jgi:hypothetical protein
MSNSLQVLYQKIEDYKGKFYKNQLLKGTLIAFSLLLSLFLFVNFIEYFGRFGSGFRAILLFAFIGISLYTAIFLIVKPLLHFLKIGERLSNDDAAADIGKFFPEIGDRLLNTLQLSSTNANDNELLLASIEQKSSKLKFFNFPDAINIRENRKYLKYTIPPIIILLFISAISPTFFQSSERILNFRQEFIEAAPFEYNITNENLEAFRNEDFKLEVELTGHAFPEEVFLVYNERRFKMNPVAENTYSYTFNKLQQSVNFNFLASGFESMHHELSLLSRAELLSFDVIAQYPSYLGKEPEKLENVGNLIVPEGTNVRWIFKTQFVDSVALVFNPGINDVVFPTKQNNLNEYSASRRMTQSSDYQISMKNNQVINEENIAYYINVIPDLFPQIQLEQIRDTALYTYIALGGNVSDDYGLSDFKLKYRKKGSKSSTFNELAINFNKGQLSQSFFYQLDLSPMGLTQNDEIEYYLEVWDNDGVNGAKSTKTSLMTFGLPSSKEFDQEVEKQVEDTENKMEELLKKSEELKKSLEKLDKDLKTKKELDFQDRKRLEELIKKREEMLKDLQDLKKQFDQMQEKQNRFQEPNPETQEKMEQLEKLLQELMQDKENELFKQLEEMLEKNEENKVQDQIQKMKEQDRNLNKDIDRALKLFKNMQLKQKVEQVTKELEKLAEKQEELAEKTEENKDSKKNEELAKEQKKLSKEFEEKKEKMEDIEKLSKELRKEIDTQKEEQKEVSEEQKKAEEELQKDENSKSSKSQKKAAKSMKSMAAQMSAQIQSAEMKQMDLDMDALRAILENLVKLSFDQERVMKDLKGLSKSDPRFVEFSQQQLKLTDDAKVIEDSLYSLAQRVMQIESFVTKEVTEMNNSMSQSIELLKERNLPRATAKQQFSMTSINNLALMLSDTFKQMQDMMAMSMPGSGKGGKQGSMPMPGLGEQQQELNEKMKGLGKSGMNATEMSKELAKLANEQAKIRKQLEKMQESINGTEMGKKLGGELQKLKKEMDDAENEIVNKRVNPELIKRQLEIQTRLLDAEKAIKEQELDTKRKSKTAIEIKRDTPPSLENFMREKEKQLELIRTTPPNFTPFYKRETDNYFRRIN